MSSTEETGKRRKSTSPERNSNSNKLRMPKKSVIGEQITSQLKKQ